jgi:hypothetical protein
MAAFTSTVNDAVGLGDGGTTRAVGASGGDPAGLSDAALGNIGSRTRTVTDTVGLVDGPSRQDIADTFADPTGTSDLVTVPGVITPPAPPDPTASPTLPDLIVEIAFGSRTPTDPAAGGFILGVSQLGTGTLGSVSWTTVTPDLVSLATTPSPGGVSDTASPGSASITLENYTGWYDPDNAAGPYVVDVGQHVRIRAQWNSVVYSLFYGYVDEVTPDYGLDPTVTFTCTDGLAVLGRAKVLETAVGVGDGDRTERVAVGAAGRRHRIR